MQYKEDGIIKNIFKYIFIFQVQICTFIFPQRYNTMVGFHWHPSNGLPGPSPSTPQPSTTPGPPIAQPVDIIFTPKCNWCPLFTDR